MSQNRTFTFFLLLLAVSLGLVLTQQSTLHKTEAAGTATPDPEQSAIIKDWNSINIDSLTGSEFHELIAYAPDSLVNITALEVAERVVVLKQRNNILVSKQPVENAAWNQVANLSGYHNVNLLKAFYERAKIARGPNGYPNETGLIFPWYVAAAVAAPETNTQDWGTVDPTTPGPWGSYTLEEGCKNLAAVSANYQARFTLCQQGAEQVASAMGISDWRKIYGSSQAAIGRTQVLVIHFAPSQIFSGLQANVGSLDVWNNSAVIAETTLVHLVSRGSQECPGKGASWYQTDNIDDALCGYNPGSWEIPEHQWYWDAIQTASSNLQGGFILALSNTASQKKSGGKDENGVRLEQPVLGYPTITYGYGVPALFTNAFHDALDLYAKGSLQTAVAVTDAKIHYIEKDRPTVGGIIVLESTEYPGYYACYFHLKSEEINWQVGQKVKRGDEIGIADGSGTISNGPHLHFEWGRNNCLDTSTLSEDPTNLIDWK